MTVATATATAIPATTAVTTSVGTTTFTGAFWNGALNGVWAQSDGSTTSNWQTTALPVTPVVGVAGAGAYLGYVISFSVPGAIVPQPLIPTGIVVNFAGIGTTPATMTLGASMSVLGLATAAANTSPINLVADGNTPPSEPAASRSSAIRSARPVR